MNLNDLRRRVSVCGRISAQSLYCILILQKIYNFEFDFLKSLVSSINRASYHHALSFARAVKIVPPRLDVQAC
jgi:hypothetical protein